MRTLSLFGLGAIFILISPSLRLTIGEGFGHWASRMELYSPYSYMALVGAILLAFIYSLKRSSRAR